MSNLIEHARYEMERAGLFDPDADYGGAHANAVMELVETFAKQGHSGMSAAITLRLFCDLAQFKPIGDITSDPDEWNDVSDISDTPLWQNKRRGTSFSRDGGKTWYDIDDASLNNGDTWLSEEQTKAYLRDVGLAEDTPIVLDTPTNLRIWDELYEMQRGWREEQGLPDDGSVMFDADFNRALRSSKG
jgi:hypothetical protein